MHLSERGTELIANFEGFRSTPYWDVDHYSIGYGTRAHSQDDGPISKAEGLRRLRAQVDEHYAPAVRRLGVPLNQNQFDALVSFAYNLGPGVLELNQPVGHALRQKKYEEAADLLLNYNKANGQVLAGLTRRRQTERALFLRKPPIDYSEDEQRHLKVLRDKTARPTTRDQAAKWLKGQAKKIQDLARGERNGWSLHDRARRYQGIRRSLKRHGYL